MVLFPGKYNQINCVLTFGHLWGKSPSLSGGESWKVTWLPGGSPETGSGTTSPSARLSPSSQSYLSCHLSSWPLTHELFEEDCGWDGVRYPIVRKRVINWSHPLRSVTKELKRRKREESGQVGDEARPASLRRPCWCRTRNWWRASWEVAEGKL